MDQDARQATDGFDTHVLAAIRTLSRLELVLGTLRAALNQLSEADARWVRGAVPLGGMSSTRSPVAESYRLPKERSKRDAWQCRFGADGYALMDSLAVMTLNPFGVCLILRCCGAFGCSNIPAAPAAGALEEVRWRQNSEEPRPCGFSRPMTSMCATAPSATPSGWAIRRI